MQERVGFGAHKIELKAGATREERIRRSGAMLSRVLNLRTTVAFVGAGCSVPLGYPTWAEFTKLLVARAIEVCRSASHDSKSSDSDMLERFEKQLESGQVSAPQKMFILGESKKVFDRCDRMKQYYKFLRRTFKPRRYPADVLNPYDVLLELPIRRFITTNYDREIEKALTRKGQVSKKEFGLHRRRRDFMKTHRDFTQEHNYYDQLALFAMARAVEADYMVFHCHGQYNRAESLIVTEADYQHWYLGQESIGSTAFAQTISLLFGSNPILFVGYGMSDDDLLGTLRRFVAVDPDHKSSRPLFALLPERVDGEDDDGHRFLYERYGVNVIPYVVARDEDRNRALCDTLASLKNRWTQWRDGWLQKPIIRKIYIEPNPPAPYHHYPLISEDMPDFGGERVRDLLQDLKLKAEQGTQLIALVGPGGTGKSWYAQQVMEMVQNKDTRFRGFFFWSSYYADDSLTGLDRALCYLDRDRKTKGSRIDRFRQCLQNGNYFLVFDGIERFLRETDNPEEGAAFEPNTSDFLAAMAHPDNKSTVLLTSRLWPGVFSSPDFEQSKIHRVRIPLFTTDDIEGVSPFNWFENREDISALCSLLDGHIYGLVLAGRMIRQAGREHARECWQRIRRGLYDSPPHVRISKMIGESIKSIDEHWGGLALKVLERLAVFMRPVEDPTVEICYRAALEGKAQPDEEAIQSLLEALLASRLLHKVQAGSGRHAYTVHPIVRGYVYQRIHHASTDLIPNFSLPGFTAGTATVDPGDSKESARVVTDVFTRLHAAAERELEKQDNRTDAERNSRNLCRAAFGVVRSRMEANTSPRWCTYDDYLRILINIGNLAKSVSPRVWDYAERHDILSVEDLKGPFYPDELAWLYNEIGLTSYSQGTIIDALAVWEQGYEINRVIDSFEEGGRYLFQSLCNLGAAYIHFGNINTAERYIRLAEQANYNLKDDDHAGRLMGYVALIQHLRGNLQQADEKYCEALMKLKVARNPRAQSIFLRHRADLKIHQDDFETAAGLIQTSRSLAEAERYPELIAYSRLSLGHLHRRKKDYPKALREYNAVYSEGRRIGMRRLQAEALTELSRLAYDLGDAQLSRERAIESLRIANELVLGLRQTHNLVVLGLATIETGQPDLGASYLRHAKKIADRQEYWLRSYEAEAHLQKYGDDETTASARR